MLHAKYSGKFLKKLKKYAAAIAPAAKEIMRQQWDNRTECKIPPEAKDIYGDHCFGAVDVTPIYVNKSFLIELIFRPAKREWNSALYNGKYKSSVVKIQLICDWEGVPLFVR